MEEDQTYIKGFNAGYKLAQFTPDLWGKLRPSLSGGNEYEKGVIDGAEEHARTKQKEREKDLASLRNRDIRENDRER